jgi:pentatricopeptide repeat protein
LGRVSLAFSVFGKIMKHGYHIDTVTLNVLMKGLCVSGNVSKALEFHDEVVGKGFRLNEVSYGILINGLCKDGKVNEAIHILRMMERGCFFVIVKGEQKNDAFVCLLFQ